MLPLAADRMEDKRIGMQLHASIKKPFAILPRNKFQPRLRGRSPGWMKPCLFHALLSSTVRAFSVGRGPSSWVRIAVQPSNHRADEQGSMRGAPLVTLWCFL